MKTIDDLKTMNSGATLKMEMTVEEIDNMLDDPDISLGDESRLISRRASLQAQINNQMLVQAHLKASVITVEFTPKDERDLDNLSNKLDKFVIQGLTVSAMLGLVPKIIDTAVSIGSSLNSHTGTPA